MRKRPIKEKGKIAMETGGTLRMQFMSDRGKGGREKGKLGRKILSLQLTSKV